eukprot:5771705-Alexandrium_andersonii.AAC.1
MSRTQAKPPPFRLGGIGGGARGQQPGSARDAPMQGPRRSRKHCHPQAWPRERSARLCRRLWAARRATWRSAGRWGG